VRAGAVWSLGAVGTMDHLALLGALVKDPDAAVAGNAAGALGRVAARSGEPSMAAPVLCAALAEPRPYVRANALEGLSLGGAQCEPGAARDLLARDPSEPVRVAAADYLARAIARAGEKALDADRRALARCAGEEHDAAVATRCSRPVPVPAAADADDVVIYVVPDGRGAPLARAPFTLVRADGLLRMGLSDRRGELFEAGAPRGVIRLGVPAALVR
jgi:HEAT repeat protein